MSILDLLGSVLSGGATGLLGSVITHVVDYKAKKLELDGQLALRKADADIMAAEWAARTRVADITSEAAKETADAAAFGKSFDMEPKAYSSGVAPTKFEGLILVGLDALRAIVRPGLTIYLCVLTTYLYWDAHKLVGTSLSSADAVALVNKIINTITYLYTTCVLWWFGTRNAKKKE